MNSSKEAGPSGVHFQIFYSPPVMTAQTHLFDPLPGQILFIGVFRLKPLLPALRNDFLCHPTDDAFRSGAIIAFDAILGRK